MINKPPKNNKNKEKLIRFIKKAFKRMDWEAHSQRITWELNAPKCLCSCCYENWLKDGKSLYQNQMEVYQEIVKEEEFHRGQRRLSRESIRKNYFF